MASNALSRRGLKPTLVSIAVASCFATGVVLANPTGPSVVNGTAAIQGLGTNLLQVTNSPSAIINWQGFSIGASEITRFIQQSQSSAVLNRVVGAGGAIDPSVILGALQSNGRVFLINPSGILFGAGAQIDVAGLIATSLNLSNADFLAGRLNFTEMPGAGSIVNQANITTGAGGEVYLVGPAVTNSGILTSPQGEVVLAAGNSVELVSPGTPNLRVEVNSPDNEARNLGQIVADAGRVGIVAGLIDHSGTIRADSAVSEGGRILLKATKSATLRADSVLSAQGQGGGKIEVLADEKVEVAGRLDASAPVSGDGGFIETSANKVSVADGTVVTTAAPQGNSGRWLIDPENFLIASTGGNISGALLSSNLLGGAITIDTRPISFDPGEPGNITIDDAISWSSSNSLSLFAHNNVAVNQSVINSGSGGINFIAGWNGSVDGQNMPLPNVTPGTGDIILVAANVQTGGSIAFKAGRDIDVSAAIVRAGSGIPVVNITAGLDAGRNITINGSTVKATSGTGGQLDSTSFTKLMAGGDITVSGGSVLEAGESTNHARQANVEVTSTGGNIAFTTGSKAQAWGEQGDLNIDHPAAIIEISATGAGKTVSVSGSSSLRADGPDAEILVAGNGGVSVDNGQLNAIGGVFSGNDGSALIAICGGSIVGENCGAAAGSTVSIINGSTVSAEGADILPGGDAMIGVQGGAITVSGSSVQAVAGSNGIAKLGIKSTGSVNLNTAIVRANAPNNTAIAGIMADGAISATGSTIEAVSGSVASAILGIDAGTDLTLSGGTVAARDTGGGPALLGLSAGNNVTLGGNVASEGTFGSPGWYDAFVTSGDIPGDAAALIPVDYSGIGVKAGNQIVGGAGVLSANRDQTIALQATNGIGNLGAPVKILDGSDATGSDLYFQNVGGAGDIAVSFTTNNVEINGDVFGTFNANPAGTFFINVESGGFALNAPFQPSSDDAGLLKSDLNGQSLMVTASGNIALGLTGTISTTTGNTTLTSAGGSIALGGDSLIQSSAGGTITLNSASTITESGTGHIGTTGTLFTTSSGNQTLNGANTVAFLSAVTGGGSLSFTNAGSLSVSGATTSGGAVNVIVNPGTLTIPGQINAGTGAIILNAPSGTVFGTGTSPDIVGGSLSILAGLDIDGAGGLHTNVPQIISLSAPNGLINVFSTLGGTTLHSAQAGSTLTLNANGPLMIVPLSGNAIVSSGDAMVLNGTNITLGSASQTSDLDIVAGNGMAITGGNLMVLGGDGGHTFVRTSLGNMAIATTGDVIVTGGTAGGFAHVLGSPDLTMSVGGTVQMNATDATAPARIEAAAPTTIFLDFTTVTSGGFFVNGQENVTSDPALGTGFYADGAPAVPGVNLQVSYSGVPAGGSTTTVTDPVVTEINQIVSTINDQTDVTTTTNEEEEKKEQVASSESGGKEGEKKKDLPVCN